MQAWLNGTLLADPEAPYVRLNDHGFTVGDGVFEALKVINGKPFALTRHLDRLTRSAQALGLPAPDLDLVRRGVAEVLHAEPHPLGRLRITFTGGPAPLGSGRGDCDPTLAIVSAEMSPAEPSTAVVTVPWPRNERSALAGVKSTSYAENVVWLAHAKASGASEAVCANLAGHLCEGTGSNVFYVVDGEVRTSTLASGCLSGVTRSLICEWAEVREVDESIDVALAAEEWFLASTTRDVQPVHRVNDRSLPVPGSRTQELMALWRSKEAEGIDP